MSKPDIHDTLRALLARQPKVSYTVAEAAAMTGVSETRIRQMVADDELGKVPHLGVRVIIPHAELERRFGTTKEKGAA